jgi:parallel beta-helix repeat protein
MPTCCLRLSSLLAAQVHNAKGVGILVCDNARGLIEDNDIAGNARAGVAILSGGNPLVRCNRIHDGKDSGVLVSEKGKGRIEENEIFANLRAGVAILREGAPLVSRNKIFDGCARRRSHRPPPHTSAPPTRTLHSCWAREMPAASRRPCRRAPLPSAPSLRVPRTIRSANADVCSLRVVWRGSRFGCARVRARDGLGRRQ